MLIICAVDGSTTSMAALERANRLASWLDAELEVVYVSHLPPIVLAAAEHAPLQLDELGEFDRREVWRLVDETLETQPQTRGGVTKVDLEGYPPDVIAEYSEKREADLVVVGSRGRGALASLVLGSTSQRLLHLTPCDVLIVKGGHE
ncbi:MAG: universal stress protein [Acidimicrobiia bacterium]|nr:universal stress protein [Acidimicrobiia bacterium]MBT8214936.1 universal stress protein [Acidimicrobiia bacterium]NNF69621.1 universal stress protein [Acidimicrobiia bacterium]NNK91693.1 universal stress protein [Acidimicrobiia bacterium]